MPARPYVPGVPAAGHISSGGYWHPGRIDGCAKCPTTKERNMPQRQRSDDLLGYAEVAVIAHVSPSTLRAYRAQGRMPEPDALPTPDRPRWRRATITTWLANRPGQGNHRTDGKQ